MTKDRTEPAAVAADIVFFGDWSLFAHDDATKTCREFTLDGIGQHPTVMPQSKGDYIVDKHANLAKLAPLWQTSSFMATTFRYSERASQAKASI